MKELMLLNPVKRRRHSSRKRTRRHHRRNPVKHRKRSHRRRRHRSNPVRHHRRRRRSYSRRRIHRRNPVRHRRRSHRRRRFRRNPISLGGLTSSFKDLVSKDTLTIAGGAVGAGLLTTWLASQFGPYKKDAAGNLVANDGFVLPGLKPSATSPNLPKYAAIAYGIAIPVGVSVLVKRFSPRLAQGAMYGAAVILVQNILNLVQGYTGMSVVASAPTAGAGAYLTRGTINALPGGAPGYSATRAFGGAMDNNSAFRGAWSLARR
jgi:hypothetical protein